MLPDYSTNPEVTRHQRCYIPLRSVEQRGRGKVPRESYMASLQRFRNVSTLLFQDRIRQESLHFSERM